MLSTKQYSELTIPFLHITTSLLGVFKYHVLFKPIFSDLNSFPLQFYVVAFVECSIFQEKKGEVVVTMVERVIMVGVCASRR